MKALLGVRQLEKPLVKSVLTIGNFDGLHQGHRKIISRVRALAEQAHSPSIVMTFDPHPRQVLFPDQAFKRLFLREDLQQQLEAERIEYLVLEPFSRELSQMEPEAFIHEKIIKPFNPSSLVVGYDFSFGANRKGTLPLLEQILKSLHVALEIIPPLKHKGEIISSTRIRQAIAEGDVSLAAEFLGRSFYVEGVVVKGAERGRTIGFPTANLSLKSPLTPKPGVYSGWLHFKGKRYKSVTNIGINPTFQAQGSPVKFEVHVLNFSQDLYGESVRFEFHNRIRDEMKFAGVDQLVEQIKKDIVVASQSLAD
jgi:riboflavin kinase/FMN adenylyltransferase